MPLDEHDTIAACKKTKAQEGRLTWANWKAMAPGPYCEFATKFFAFLITFCVVLIGSPAGSPSVITITWKRTDTAELLYN